jgi:hypothetical protein
MTPFARSFSFCNRLQTNRRKQLRLKQPENKAIR